MKLAFAAILALCLAGGAGFAQDQKKIESKSKNPKAKTEKKKAEEFKDHKDSQAKTKSQNETVKK